MDQTIGIRVISVANLNSIHEHELYTKVYATYTFDADPRVLEVIHSLVYAPNL